MRESSERQLSEHAMLVDNAIPLDMSRAPIGPKERLLCVIADVISEAKEVERLGHGLIESARFTQDMAAPISDFFSSVPPDQLATPEWARQVEAWHAVHKAERRLHETQTQANSFGAVTQAAANTSTTTITRTILGSSMLPQVTASLDRINQVLSRIPLVDKATVAMRRLGLDARGGNDRPALDLLKEAVGALDRPVIEDGGPVSILIPLRECINTVITELIRRRPRQEPVRGWRDKIVSVGRQCARPLLDVGHFERLGDDAGQLMNTLSGAKRAAMSREQLAEHFNQGLLFLNTLMDSVDESRLRRAGSDG